MSNTNENLCLLCGKTHKNNNPFCENFVNTHNDALREDKNISFLVDEYPVSCGSIFENSQSILGLTENYACLSTPTSTEQ